jgi:serine/threonine protein kinase
MNRAIDARSDLYSFGVTLYEMLTGVLPFQATDPMELVHSHIARVPPSPREIGPLVPRAASDIVMRLLAKSAEERYQSASGVCADLTGTSESPSPCPLSSQLSLTPLTLPH